MGLPHSIKRYTPEEYCRLENGADGKSDYYKGEIFAMSGGTARHSRIIVNISAELRTRLRGSPCEPFDSGFRLKAAASGLITYPDVSVYCGPLNYTDDDPSHQTVTNPTVVFEVLSRSTERYDRGIKALSYQQISSLQAYVLVSQNNPRVEMFERQPDGPWAPSDIQGLEAVLPLRALGIEIPLREIYERVNFAEFDGDADAS